MAYRDLVATIGKYEKDGQTKYVSRKVGTLLETDKGTRVKLDASFNPAGCLKSDDGGVWLAVFDPKPREQAVNNAQGSAQQGHAASGNDFDDDIGF